MMKNRLIGAAAFAVAATIAMPDMALAAEVDPGAANHIVARVNQERAAHGLAPLALRADVSDIATGHSNAMAAQGTLWHSEAYFTEANRQRLNARGLGENVALNGDIEDAHRRLMASPGHRANILSGAFDTIGIGVVREGNTLYVTQNFVDTNEGGAQAAPAKDGSKAEAKATKAKKGKGKVKARKVRARSIRRR